MYAIIAEKNAPNNIEKTVYFRTPSMLLSPVIS